MTTSRTVTVEAAAADRKAGMTRDQLVAFVQEAQQAEIDGTAIVHIDTTWRTSIRRITVTG